MEQVYRQQVSLLLSVLPEVAKEKSLALHGGTAINLFVRNMPRLSVDIDLTYLPIENRETSLRGIAEALQRIKVNIQKVIRGVQVASNYESGKLLILLNGVNIKLEVNPVNRGSVDEPKVTSLCQKAQEAFEAFCTIPIVPNGQLFGGKIIAALDRQHPRDLFDVKYLLEKDGFSKEIKDGFMLFLLCSVRPIYEIIFPNFQDQRSALTNQFAGMTDEPFNYDDYESTREKLVATIHQNLTQKDKEFLLSFKNGTPDWSIYDFQRFPSVNWKLQNILKLRSNDPDKQKKLYERLRKRLYE